MLAFLEDRRVLFVDSEIEIPQHCVESVLRIREFLTNEIKTLPEDAERAASLRALRPDCRKFLATVASDDDRIIRFGAQHGHDASWTFNGALGSLRGAFGVHLAKLAASCDIDVEDQLASMLPAPDAGQQAHVAAAAQRRSVRGKVPSGGAAW